MVPYSLKFKDGAWQEQVRKRLFGYYKHVRLL